MALHASLGQRLRARKRSGASSWLGAVVLAGLFALPAAGCGGCDGSSLVCDADGNNCQICDGYGCHPANPNANGDGGGSGTTSTTGGTGGASSGTGGASSGTGGAPPCNPEKAACACPESGECPSGLACIAGVCAPGCNFSYECGPGNVCLNGACTPGCDPDKPCAAGYTCENGACVLDQQNPQCSAASPCPAPEVCVDGICTNQCFSNEQCAMGEICDGSTGACIPDPSPHKACGDMVMCPGAGQKCLDDGYCHYPCDNVSQCKLIDNRFVACDMSICKTAEEVEPECTLAKPCPAGKDCVSNKCL